MRTKFSGILTLLLAFVVQFSFAQQQSVSGTVTDDMGLPLPGVNIIIKETTSGTQSDFDGNYSINVAVGETLVFSYVGFDSQEVAVTPATNTVNVQMVAGAVLDEVVVTGYITRRRDLTSSSVSRIGAEDIEALVPTTTIDNMLQGMASGVQVAAASGQPGQPAFVRIRGQASLTTGAMIPLYIVDGVPMDETNLNAVSSLDVENVTILKDAASTAMYGSRGAAGVVIITTKSGRKNRDAEVRVNSRFGVTEVIQNWDLMNASQKLDFEAGLAALSPLEGSNNPYAGLLGANITPEERAELIRNSVDWTDLVTRTGFVQSNNFSVSGGTEKTDYYFSAGHERDNGIIENRNGFESINSRLRVNIQAKEWLEVYAGVGFTRAITDQTRERFNAQSPFVASFQVNPYERPYVYDEDGNIALDDNGNPVWNWTAQVLNPIEYVRTNTDNRVTNTTMANAGVKVHLRDNLSYNFQTAVNHRNFRRETFGHPGNRLDQLIGDPEFPGSRVDNGHQDLKYTLTSLINYNPLSGDHHLGFTGLYEFNFEEFNSYSISTSGYSNLHLSPATNAGRVDNAVTNRSRYVLQSYGIFTDYNYKERYIFDLYLRTDGSSNFPEDNRYGTFYGGSLAWILTNEDWFNVNGIDFLKLGAGYGITGNRSIGRYPFQDLVTFNNIYPGGQSMYPSNVGNTELQWEESTTTDIGLEFSLLNRRLRGVVSYFVRNTDNLLFPRPTSHESGIPGLSINSNIGEIENRGIEIDLSGDVIRTQNTRLIIGGNITFYDHEIIRLPDPEEPGESNDILAGNPGEGGFVNWSEGHLINEFFLVRYDGVDPQTGQPMYLNANGERVPWSEIDANEDRVMTGKTTIPKYEGGFYLDFNYKGWGLRGDFVYRMGHHVYNSQRQWMTEQYARSATDVQNTNQAVIATNYWQNPGDTNVDPNPLYSIQDGMVTSDRFLDSADFLRLRNLTISYDLPRASLDRLPFNSLRIFAQGQNLWTLTDFFGDPEVGIAAGDDSIYNFSQVNVAGVVSRFAYPQRKTFSIGIDLTF